MSTVFTFLGNNKIHIREIEIIPSETQYHHFLAGKILTILDNVDIRIALHDHELIISEIMFKGEICKPSKVCKIMEMFHTPIEYLTNARLQIPRVKNMSSEPYIN